MKMMNSNQKNRIPSGRNPQFFREDPSVWKSRDYVLAAVSQARGALEKARMYAGDEEVVLVAIRAYAESLQYASYKLRDTKKIVMEAVTRDGRALEFASERLSAEKEVVLTAVCQNGLALEFADDSLRNDPEIVLHALKQNPEAFKFIGEKLRENKQFMERISHFRKKKFLFGGRR